MRTILWLPLLGGCISELNQAAGTGAVYYTRCSADMLQTDGQYRAQCEPESCIAGFQTGSISHVVVALDPGRKVVGFAERLCFQDLSRSSGLFNPALVQPPQGTVEPPDAEAAQPTPTP